MDLAKEKSLDELIDGAIRRMIERQKRNQEMVRYIKNTVTEIQAEEELEHAGDERER